MALSAAAAALVTGAGPAGAGTGSRPPTTPPWAGSASHHDPLVDRLLAMHNRERAAARVAPLRWDPALAAAAASYGPSLAALGGLRHSPRAGRPGQSENLWMGTRAAFSPEQMVGGWIEERRLFRAGVFPYVSTTGNWGDVGHYSQMLWPTTTAVGCAMQRSPRWDFLICRYSPRGNVDGQQVG